MLSIAERHKYILEKLEKFGFIRITDVAEELGVTKVTIRKDVNILEGKGLLFKAHGSARLANPHIANRDLVTKSTLNREAKTRIAERAVQMIAQEDSIMISAGSTTYALAEAIHDMSPSLTLNVVTPFLKISALLNEVETIFVEQLGGRVYKKSFATRGESADETLSTMVCSKFFMGVDGFDPDFGITTSTIEEAVLSRKMMAAASKVIVLTDSSKFSRHGFGRVSSIEEIDVVITDKGIAPEMVKIIEEAGIELIIV
ncbi:MAG: DeoR/GlpR family DNA-binding transcription regulator [Alistipes sp.]|jgi:DeoR family transcriptional regulator of aga operon|nr:DeoR/GlpR transcriptional regulator [Alistipes sp.]MBQ6584357.1 DeoR/GlpR transcriptional regulator [Alistipes sp.]MEE0915277.1 DeoR/GlpR family DNA-binding transcription regulator [Alistipes sp.]